MFQSLTPNGPETSSAPGIDSAPKKHCVFEKNGKLKRWNLAEKKTPKQESMDSSCQLGVYILPTTRYQEPE